MARREKAIQKLELELLTAQENHRRALDDVSHLGKFRGPGEATSHVFLADAFSLETIHHPLMFFYRDLLYPD